jgi:SAM-dependent methyltransferase
MNRDVPGQNVDRMTDCSEKNYWSEVAAKFRSADATGFAPVLHPGAPEWFNRVIDSQQLRAVKRALALSTARRSSSVLDVGCGSGRWVRRYQAFGYRATGLDATQTMLQIARDQKTSAQLISGEAQRLPFADFSFDCVSDITVVQHIPFSLQPLAISEMMRVLRPDGSLILIELIRGEGLHIFPRPPEDWIRQAELYGGKLIGWFGEEFFPLDHAFVGIVQSARRHKLGLSRRHKVSLDASPREPTLARRAYWGLRRITVAISSWVDPAVEKLLPARLASHGVFVFRK